MIGASVRNQRGRDARGLTRPGATARKCMSSALPYDLTAQARQLRDGYNPTSAMMKLRVR